MHARLLGLVAVAASLPAILPAGAGAVTICVNRPVTGSPPCQLEPSVGTLGDQLSSAIAKAKADNDADQLYVGPGTYSQVGGFTYSASPGDFFLDGAGAGTILTTPSDGIATFKGSAAGGAGRIVLRGVTVQASGGVSGVGVETSVAGSRVVDSAITADRGTPTGVRLFGNGSSIENTTIEGVFDGVEIGGTDMFVTDTRIAADDSGIYSTNGNSTIRRVSVEVTRQNARAISNAGASMTIENSLLVATDPVQSQPLSTSCDGTTSARFVTLVGLTSFASCSGSGQALLSVADSVLSPGLQVRSLASSGGLAAYDLTRSRWDGAFIATGGTVTASAMRTEDPRLGSDFRLLPSSPLIDALSPVAAPIGEVFVGGDRTGAARITDGDGDGTAAPDPGAFELPAGQATPVSPPPAGPGPGPAPGATPGPVPPTAPAPTPTVTPSPVVPYRGVTLRGGRLRLDSKGRLALRATCARTARTRCRGTLTLSRTVRRGAKRVTTSYGRATVSVLPGRAQTVRVTVPRTRRSSIRAKGLALVAKAVTTDASSATRRTTTAKVTALPRKR